MATKWNYVWGESWRDYLKRKTITDDLTKAEQESTREMIEAISDQTRSILTGVETSARTVSDRIGSGFVELNRCLNSGFDELGERMNGIADNISELNSTFEWGFGQVLASLGGMDDSLKSLIKAATTPTQTAAYEHFDIARDAFDKGLYPECLTALEKAVNGDRRSSGYALEWRFHRLIGVIRLGFAGCDLSLIDLPKAEEEFLLAARYARSDAPKEAALNLLQAGWAAYVQRKFPEALARTEEAIALDPKLAEARFQAAKFMVSKTSMDRSLETLRGAIDLDPGYVVKASADGEFRRYEGDLNGFFAAMRSEKYAVLAPKVRAALAEAEEHARTVTEVRSCSEVFKRQRSLLEDDWGLLDLLMYERKFAQDQKCVSERLSLGLTRIAKEREDRLRAEREMLAKAARERRELEERTAREMHEERERVEKAQQAIALEDALARQKAWDLLGRVLLGGVKGALVGFIPAFLCAALVCVPLTILFGDHYDHLGNSIFTLIEIICVVGGILLED